MKGRVLGAGAGGGAISGEDGKRYRFDAANWNSERSPAQGDEVDFEAGEDGSARDVYSLRNGATMEFAAVSDQAKVLLGGVNSSAGTRLIALIKGNLIFQLSLVVVVASLLLTYIKLDGAFMPGASPTLPDQGVYRLASTNDLVDYLKTSLEGTANIEDQFDQSAAYSYDGRSSVPAWNYKQAASELRGAAGLTNALYFAFLAPIGAAATAVQLARARKLTLLPLATGVACILTFVVLVLWRFTVLGAVQAMGNADTTAAAGKAIQFGLGSYITLLCGIGLVGAAIGIIRIPQKP